MPAGELRLPAFPRDFFDAAEKSITNEQGMEKPYERRVECQICFSWQDEVKWDVTAAQLRVWAFRSLDRGEIRPKVKDRADHR